MCDLIPIRIDASSSEADVRLVDTILVDPFCLPMSPSAGADDVTDASIDKNASYFAATLLADMEIQATNKSTSGKQATGRSHNFLGRQSLIHQVETQIREQLRLALVRRLVTNTQTFANKEDAAEVEKLDQQATNHKRPRDTQSSLLQSTNIPNKFATLTPSSLPMGAPSITNLNNNTTIHPISPKTPTPSKLCHIKIRIRKGGIVIKEDFEWDPSIPSMEGGCPISVANGLVKDLNLTADFAVPIAISITEQLHGVKIEDQANNVAAAAESIGAIHGVAGAGGSRMVDAVPQGNNIAWAWKLDSKELSSAEAKLLAKYHPLRVSPPIVNK